MLLPHQVALLLSNEDSSAELEELLRVGQLLVHHSLAYAVEYDANEAANGDDDGGVESDDRELQGVSKEGSDNLFVVEQDDQALILVDLLLLHLGSVLLSELLVKLAGRLLSPLCPVLRLDLLL